MSVAGDTKPKADPGGISGVRDPAGVVDALWDAWFHRPAMPAASHDRLGFSDYSADVYYSDYYE